MIAKEAIQLIEQIKNFGYKPNKEELNFIQTLISMARADLNRALSYRQANWINMIYRYAAGGGQYQPRQYGNRRP